MSVSVATIESLPALVDPQAVLNRARHAQQQWAQTPLRQRLAVIKRFRHALAGHALTLARIVEQSRGSKVAEVLAAEVLPLADACRFLEREAQELLRPQKMGTAGRPVWLTGVASEVWRDPLGVILILGPSNYPLMLPGVEIVQALVAGNALIVKPGHGGSPVLERLLHIFTEAGLPEDLVQLVPEDPRVVEPLVRAGVDKIFLTGSADTGCTVAQLAAENLTPLVAELSGCDAGFVLPGADLDLVSAAMKFSLRWNRSETCIATRRLFVPHSLLGELESRLTTVIHDLHESWQPTSRSGSAASLIHEAIDLGARMLVETDLDDDNGLSPVVLSDVTADMPIAREDVFAPVLSIIPVADVSEALRLSRQCPYALGASVFGPEDEARTVAKQISAGAVVINDVIVPTADPRLPFGGRKRSGFGVTRGREGLLEMTTIKTITRRRGQAVHLSAPHATDEELFQRLIKAMHGSTWWGRMKHWLAMCPLLSKRWFS